VTHRHTLSIRGTVISGRDEPDVTANAWAADTVIELGSDEVRGTSRGSSHVIDLGGSSVVALGERPDVLWPPDATLEVGGRADLAVLESDPRRMDAPAVKRMSALALIRGGCVVAGRLPREILPRATTEGALAEP
jgi:predicted amidohydrolase YtcJ